MSDLYDLYRVTCEEYYDCPDLAHEARRISDAEEPTALECDPNQGLCDPDDVARVNAILNAGDDEAIEVPVPSEGIAECTNCGGYGYLGVRDELCGCGQSKDEDDADFVAYLNGSHSLGALAQHDDIPF